MVEPDPTLALEVIRPDAVLIQPADVGVAGGALEPAGPTDDPHSTGRPWADVGRELGVDWVVQELGAS